MTRDISKAEKTDVLLALALAFEKKFGGEPEERFDALPKKYFAALPDEDLAALRARAGFLDELSAERRRRWQEIQLEKLRRRGRPTRLDENINPSYLAEFLSRESHAAQQMILRNLPVDLGRRIAFYLELNFEIRDLQIEPPDGARPVGDEINALVKGKFLANFIGLEDLYEPDTLDQFSVSELEEFVHHLGLREIAIACRGITSKETLAAFLNRFGETDAREIALYITELERIRPFWVTQADELVRQSWSADLPTELVLRKIGLRLLAAVYVARDDAAQRYTAQKLSMRDAKNWFRSVREFEKSRVSGDEQERVNLDRRRKSIERLAAKFAEHGRL